ncbi:MAG: Uma2 family endonuclease [Microcoleaceae cyanobacterium]
MIKTPALVETQTISINISPDLKLSVTPQQFEAIAAVNREVRLERTSQGELIVNPPTGWETGKRNWSISGELYLWWRSAGEPGEAFDSSTGFTLPNGAILSPDASWISQPRWDALTAEEKGTFPNICPDFVVELRSKSDSFKSLQTKMKEYLENGAKLGWLIDPKRKIVEIYRPQLPVEILENPTELSGENVLPNFVLNLSRIWSE